MGECEKDEYKTIYIYIYSMIPFQMHTQEKRLEGKSKMVTGFL